MILYIRARILPRNTEIIKEGLRRIGKKVLKSTSKYVDDLSKHFREEDFILAPKDINRIR